MLSEPLRLCCQLNSKPSHWYFVWTFKQRPALTERRMKSHVLVTAVLLLIQHLLAQKTNGDSSRSSYACTSRESKSYSFCDKALSIDERVADLISRLSLEEKISQLGNGADAISSVDVPAYQWWGEALHGVAYCPSVHWDGPVKGATSFPMPISLAASFNKSLWNKIGQVISTEGRAMHNLGQSGLTFWSPVINLVRDPRWGRVQETPGEDPYLIGQYSVYFVRGMQEAKDYDPSNEDDNENENFALKTSACCKHYTAYDLDNWQGVERYDFDAKVTIQDLADTYNPPFQSCVEEGRASCLMCSYNKVNGVPTCADPELLKGTVREKWGLRGYIVTDCDSLLVMYDESRYSKGPAEAIATAMLAGLDLNCGATIKTYGASAVQQRLISEADIDRALNNTFTVLMRLGIFDGNPLDQPYGRLGDDHICSEEHQDLATEAAVQGMVLLKNDEDTLPLSSRHIKTLAIIGPNADDTKYTMLGNYAGRPCTYITPLQGLSTYEINNVIFEPGCSSIDCSSDEKIEDALSAAKKADVVILVMGLDQDLERETFDRNSLKLPGKQELLVSSVANVSNGPVVLVLICGGPLDISWAKNDSRIQSILWMGYPGQAGGLALAQIVFGDRNPVGRLPVTWYPESITDWPMTCMNMRPDPHTGYPGRTHRFYNGPTVYEFGYGMTYSKSTTMEVTGPTNFTAPALFQQACYHKRFTAEQNDSTGCSPSDLVACLEASLPINITVKNRGPRAVTEVALVYHVPPRAGENGTQLKELIAFERTEVQPFSSKKIHLIINLCHHTSTVKSDGKRSLQLGTHKVVVSPGSGTSAEHRFYVH
ncbi:beta-glucosidase [Marchantia polymorpha subsp. ruderalis]|uniref:Fibronectin type III-like domain-containing protein n=2 Tax=Marchantia polymorpha TaxID=3197 RepID=A0AAF6BIR0_MARPO|nr:hypothetical protein MARPO_0071s0042 [Marchantia polymorpha]BBN11894.1 hypothetical protein Mp_5g15680 [Marchantia polymorpha subsp. ruderalis]|eukprot:PTQ35426.1 hypothetical protein MARPO_0071s0042 [Marchantia polymorpha]